MKKCEKCGSGSIIYDSRPNKKGEVVRRRKCEKCGYRWQTIEVNYWKYAELLKKVGDQDVELL